jgi:hypothetical protein
MISQSRIEWETFVSEDQTVDKTHELINSFKYFSNSHDASILVNEKPYTRISRALHDDNGSNVKHINRDRDILYKICKVIAIHEDDPSKTKIGHKIIYFRDVSI